MKKYWKTGNVKRALSAMALTLVCLASAAQSSFDYFYLEAEKHRLAGDFASSMELYRHCLDISPTAPAATYNLGILFRFAKQDSLGMDMLKKASSQDSLNPWYLETLASIYLSKHDNDNAIPVLERMAKIQTKRSDILYQLANIYGSNEMTDKAIEALNRVEMLEGKNRQLSVHKYGLYMDCGDTVSALNELQALCGEFPHDINYKVLIADHYKRVGHPEKAFEIYDSIRAKDPDNINMNISRMFYYFDMGDDTEYRHLRDSIMYDKGTDSETKRDLMKLIVADAIGEDTIKTDMVDAAFDSLLSVPQKDILILNFKALYQKNFLEASDEEVAETVKRMLEVEPSNQAALQHMLRYYASRKDYTSLEDICRKGINYYPEEMAYAYYLGITLWQQKRGTEAEDVLKLAIATKGDNVDPEQVSDMYAALGDIYHETGKIKDAYAAYDSALVYSEDNISCLNNYAYYLSLLGEQLDKAEDMSYRTVRAEPDNITYLDTYAWILFMKHDYRTARIYMDKAADPKKSDDELMGQQYMQGTLLEHAGDIHYHCGDTETALRMWTLAEKMNDGTCSPSLPKKIKKRKYVK